MARRNQREEVVQKTEREEEGEEEAEGEEEEEEAERRPHRHPRLHHLHPRVRRHRRRWTTGGPLTKLTWRASCPLTTGNGCSSPRTNWRT